MRVVKTFISNELIEKTCSSCKLLKSKDSFFKSRKGDGYQYVCKACTHQRNRINNKKKQIVNPLYNRKASLKRRYGMTIDEYNQLLNFQKGSCGICKSLTPKNGMDNFCVDHCHSTKIVRGLLCGPCNRALGCFYDNIDNLKSAIKYLEKSYAKNN